MWLIHQRALLRGVRPVVPAGVLVEVRRSARQANLAGLLRGCPVDSLDERTAKAAGVLLGRCAKDKDGLDQRTKDIGAVDASVAEGALRRGDAARSRSSGRCEVLEFPENWKLSPDWGARTARAMGAGGCHGPVRTTGKAGRRTTRTPAPGGYQWDETGTCSC